MSLYSGAHVLITGGLGFIGSNLGIRLLEEGASVTLVDSLIPEYAGIRQTFAVTNPASKSIFPTSAIPTA